MYVKLPELTDDSRQVYIEYTVGVSHIVKPIFIKVFGSPFLEAIAQRLGELVIRKFKANQEDIDTWESVTKMMANKSIIDSLTINHN